MAAVAADMSLLLAAAQRSTLSVVPVILGVAVRMLAPVDKIKVKVEVKIKVKVEVKIVKALQVIEAVALAEVEEAVQLVAALAQAGQTGAVLQVLLVSLSDSARGASTRGTSFYWSTGTGRTSSHKQVTLGQWPPCAPSAACCTLHTALKTWRRACKLWSLRTARRTACTWCRGKARSGHMPAGACGTRPRTFGAQSLKWPLRTWPWALRRPLAAR